MTTLGMDTLLMPAADLGPPNPLPAFRELADDRTVACEPGVPEADLKNVRDSVVTPATAGKTPEL